MPRRDEEDDPRRKDVPEPDESEESVKHATLEDHLREEEVATPEEKREVEHLMKLDVEVGDVLRTKAIVDTKATYSCVDLELYNKLLQTNNIEGELPVTGIKLITAVGNKRVKIYKQVMFDVEVQSRKYRTMAFVVQGLFAPILLGINWLKEHQVQINCEDGTLDIVYECGKRSK